MPVQPRPADAFTRGALLLGFSVIEFTPTGSIVPVPLGILASESLQKEVETLPLEDGSAGLLTVNRELISRFAPSMSLELFNFSPQVARFILGSDIATPVVAEPAAAESVDVTVQLGVPAPAFLALGAFGDIDESMVAPIVAPIVDEIVGVGAAGVGGTQGDFALNSKVLVIGDVSTITVAGVSIPVVAGSTPAVGEVAVEVGLEDDIVTGSGALTFGTNVIPAVGEQILATYSPSFTLTLNTDFTVDPIFGRIRFIKSGADAGAFRAVPANDVVMRVPFEYARRASTTLNPFQQLTFDWSAVIRHLPDVGINFIWPIPSVTIRITDDDLEFGAEDFARAALQLNINDAGGTTRFGQIALSSEAESAA